MSYVALNDNEFVKIQQFIYNNAGISMSDAKKPLIMGRLGKRLREYNLSNYSEYLSLLESGTKPAEVQMAIDLLTTNETYFFREPKHFDFLQAHIPQMNISGRSLRVWSAASSSGQEAYSIGMTLSEVQGTKPWEIVASDISMQILEKARRGHYPLEQASKIPQAYLQNYCLKGVGSQQGTFLIDRKIRDRISFIQVNLNETLPSVGEFDLIFLRNVMIYFDIETKKQVIERLVRQLRPGGYLIIGHSESLNGIRDDLKQIMPSVYQKPL